MSCGTIRVSTDNVIRVEGLKNTLSGEFINDGTVEVTLTDEDGVEFAGQTWPLALDYVAASDGVYQGTLQDTIDAEDGNTGTATFDITGDGLTLTIEYDVVFGEETGATLEWTSRGEIENMFGLTNVTQWADLENQGVTADIADRIQWAVEEATEEARMRLRGSSVDLEALQCAPRPLRLATTRVAGLLLYESRGIKDVDEEGHGMHRLSWHSKRADKFFQQVRAGTLLLDDGSVSHPVVVETTEDEVTLEDLTAGQEVFL